MAFRIPWRVSQLLLASIFPLLGAPLCAEPPQFEEPYELFEPERATTEAEADRATALAYYGMACEAEGGGDRAKALRLFQRSLRYDPTSVATARSIISVAIQVERPDEAVNATLGISDWQDQDRLPLRYMALHLTRRGRWQEAVDLYERTLGIRPDEPKTAEDVLMTMEMARLCRLLDETEKAADYFQQLLEAIESPEEHGLSLKTREELLGESGAIYRLSGSCFLAAGRVTEAEAAFRKADEAAPDAGRSAFHAASIHAHAKRYEEALGELAACFDHSPEAEIPGAYRLLEETFNGLGRGDELLAYLEELREKQPKNAGLGYFLAEKQLEAGELDRAAALFAKLVEESPTSTGYQRLLEIAIKRSDYVEAGKVLAAVAGVAGTLDPLEEYLDLVTASAEAVDAIVSHGEKCLADDVEANTPIVLAAGLIALAAERFDSAAGLLAAAVERTPDRADNLLLIWGLDLLAAERHAEAARVLRDGVEREGVSDGQRAVLYYYLAAALALDEQTDAALEAAREAVNLNEDSAPFHVRVAWVLYHADRKTEAAEQYRAVIERFEDSYDSAQTRQALRQAKMVLSTLCVNEGRVDEAVEWLEQVLDEYPEDSGALNDLGYLWADENQHLERAHRMIEKAVAAEPDNAAYRDSLGWVLYRRGLFEEAVAELEKAVEMEPDAVVLDHLGDAYMKAGQEDKAVATWERSATRFVEEGHADRAAEIREKLQKDL